jgi:hypothetical protein
MPRISRNGGQTPECVPGSSVSTIAGSTTLSQVRAANAIFKDKKQAQLGHWTGVAKALRTNL